MPTAFVENLDRSVRTEMIEELNARLVEALDLVLAVKHAHWNIKGPSFIGIHLLLDEVAQRMRGHADTMAERCVILGGQAKGTVQVVAEETTLEAYPPEITRQEEHVTALKERLMAFGKAVRESISKADEAGDDDTADLFTAVSRAVDKDAWFIGAHGERS
ncbi:MAG: DNA starvation/stationary phase protection protein Dps [Geminicoccaceae bacterium]|jgi:starvation-inducible DNA-binding protein|nr:DNA starvation/stationary phase protection protein Dps [Geminicoccaceae bacterium]HRY23485.1 DNA starvation/stationary phase protection protein Dps [Geminicoccaceae bacterium]